MKHASSIPPIAGSLDKNSKNVGTGLVGAPACGDVMKLQIEVSPDGIITDASEYADHWTVLIVSSIYSNPWVPVLQSSRLSVAAQRSRQALLRRNGSKDAAFKMSLV